MPCPHFDVKIIQRSKRQSAVASAAYQSGERLFSEYDQKQKYYSHKSEIVHTEIMLPPHAPPEYADRNTLWNAAEAIEKQWNSQLARRFVLAIPRELPRSQYADLIRDYCREFFVSKGMIADFAIHDKGDGNPHAHILLTMRAMDEQGKWLPKSRKVYDLDENGERIRLASGRWKSHKEDTVDWNDQKYAEIWRQGWADTANRYLEAIGSPERLDLRSYARQGIDKIPTVHMGPAVSQLEKKGIQTNIGNLNRDIKAANSLMQSIRQMVRSLKGWLSGLKEKKAALLEALEQAKEPTIPELLSRYLDKRSEERTGWTSKGKLKGTVGDFNKVITARRHLPDIDIQSCGRIQIEVFRILRTKRLQVDCRRNISTGADAAQILLKLPVRHRIPLAALLNVHHRIIRKVISADPDITSILQPRTDLISRRQSCKSVAAPAAF